MARSLTRLILTLIFVAYAANARGDDLDKGLTEILAKVGFTGRVGETS